MGTPRFTSKINEVAVQPKQHLAKAAWPLLLNAPKTQDALGMHVVAEYVIDVIKGHFVIEHGGLSLGTCRSVEATIP